MFSDYPTTQNGLSLSDKPVTNGNAQAPRLLSQRTETHPTISHRPSRSNEDEQRRREAPSKELDIFASPEKPGRSSPEKRMMERPRRPRRNSESSAMERPRMTEEERTAREKRYKEREERRRKEGRPGRPRKPKGLDVIDKLDVTGIYGPGLFHHDGPFDACNPHRNRRKDRAAPMQAFPVGSANNALGGAGPVNKNVNLDQFHGRGVEAFTDYHDAPENEARWGPRPTNDRQISFNPADRIEPVHGEESVGLGTSTFLEGAPASRSAMQRRDSEDQGNIAPMPLSGGGITRKKSLVQRIRGISQPRPRYGEGRVISPEARYERGPTSPETSPRGPLSAGGTTRMHERNPFFDDYEGAYEKKGASIKIAEQDKDTTGRSRADSEAKKGLLSDMGRTRAPSSPTRPLQRSITADSVGEAASKPSLGVGGGFLSRVRSLKGGRRARPEIRG
ncbi:MAG: hypothetical protein M1821_007574 [Bathelium mastoideum]|nr:MAG: hypothetical protein M1821_007574 [Bathelium mastoideum]